MADKHSMGRAEFDSDIADCFEDIPIKYLMAPLLTNNEPKLIVGDRGVGKTHLLRLLAKEIPIEIHDLDKDQIFDGIINFKLRSEVEKPKLIVFDDLHYLLKAMQVIKLETGAISELAIIESLKKYKDHATQKGVAIVFVADEGVSGLSLRFNEANRSQFLELFGNCIDTPDDASLLMKYLPGNVFSTTRTNVLNLNDRGTLPFYNRFVEVIDSDMFEFGKDPAINFDQDLISSLKRSEKKLLKVSENVVDRFRMIDIPLGIYGNLYDDFDDITFFHYFINENGNISPYPYLIERKGVPVLSQTIDNRYETYKFAKRTQFATFRQLKIIYDSFGEISMDKLGISLDSSIHEDPNELYPFARGLRFNIDDLRKIIWKMHTEIKKIIGDQSFKELAKRISDPNLDPLVEYLLYDLELE
jgi:hypothetical protein